MHRFKKIGGKYIVLIAVSILLTPNAVKAAYEMREGFYIGGEWLLVPVAVLIGLVVDSFKDIIKEVQKQQ